ncbi:extracellular solute-binding protein family 5 [Halanaerobium hydrogeniformans]|uniref:Extracellular solute-binding protein family 5 n=1 Tax=Halanaerobium hydrogeniformans TaxID=656519 RepID=E4RJZ1_HALHG|nr:extracellular solute-binding protein family 5 [Halanaerobium hydrogeniformans]
MKKSIILIITIIVLFLTMAFSAAAQASSEGVYGGRLNVALKMSAPHLDSDNSTDSQITAMMNHVYEGLFEFDENLQLQPHLADSYRVLDDGKEYIVELREDVMMHNGEKMDADDVLASFERWLDINGAGDLIKPYFDQAVKLDDYTISFKFDEPYAPFLNIMASPVSNQKFVVRAKEIIDEFGDSLINRHIGTGPYMVKEWIPDQRLSLVRFEDYSPKQMESSFFAGERTAYLDEIVLNFITNAQVRVSGVQTGQFHFAEEVPRDQYPRFNADANINTQIIYPDQMAVFVTNNGIAPFDNKYARRAMVYALDLEELGYAMIGNPDFWRLEASLHEEGNPWHAENVGEGIYNVYDPDKAKELLDKADYDGTPLVILSGQDSEMERQGAISIKDQLEKIGIEVELQLFDRPTVVERRAKPEGWNIHLSSFIKTVPDPQIHQGWTGTNKWVTNWDSEESREMDEIFARMVKEVDYEQRYQIVEEFYEKMWDTVPYFNILDFSRLHITRSELKNFEAAWQTFFWNTWLEE